MSRGATQRVLLCAGCGDLFEGESWQSLCWKCWRRRKDRELKSDAYDRGYRRGLREGHKRGLKERQSQTPALLDGELLRRTIALTHPDRHPGRFTEANDVTALLLALRKGGA